MAEKENGEKVFTAVVDSGKREAFNTGSVRDTDAGKGNPHLVPPYPILKFIDYLYKYGASPVDVGKLDNVEKQLLQNILEFAEHEPWDEECLLRALVNISVLTNWDDKNEVRPQVGLDFLISPLRRVAIHYQNGANKYGFHNWRKGQPLGRYYDSLYRHVLAIFSKKDNEDHYAAVIWNILALLQTRKDIDDGFLPKELDNFPFNRQKFFEALKNEANAKRA